MGSKKKTQNSFFNWKNCVKQLKRDKRRKESMCQNVRTARAYFCKGWKSPHTIKSLNPKAYLDTDDFVMFFGNIRRMSLNVSYWVKPHIQRSFVHIHLFIIYHLANKQNRLYNLLFSGIIKFSEVGGAINLQKKSWRWLCVFFPDSLCAAVTSPSWASCFTVWPAEGVSSGVTLHTADYCAEVTADTSRYIGLASVTDQHQQQHNTDTNTLTDTNWILVSSSLGYQKKMLSERVGRFIKVWNSLRAEVANNCKHLHVCFKPKQRISIWW